MTYREPLAARCVVRSIGTATTTSLEFINGCVLLFVLCPHVKGHNVVLPCSAESNHDIMLSVLNEWHVIWKGVSYFIDMLQNACVPILSFRLPCSFSALVSTAKEPPSLGLTAIAATLRSKQVHFSLYLCYGTYHLPFQC